MVRFCFYSSDFFPLEKVLYGIVTRYMTYFFGKQDQHQRGVANGICITANSASKVIGPAGDGTM